MKQICWISLTLALCAAAPGFAAPAAPRVAPQDDVVASVNSEPITRQALIKRLITYYGTANLEAMINQVLVRQAADRDKVTVSDKEIDERVSQTKSMMRTPELFQQWLQGSGLTEQQYRDQVRYTLLTEKIVAKQSPINDADLNQARARIILVRSEAEAQEIIRKLRQGGDFIQLAKEKSIDQQSGQMGGALPDFMRADYPNVWQAISSRKPGEISDPVKLGNNYAVAKLESRLAASELTSQQRERLRQRLLNYKMNTWLDNLRKQAKVTYPVPLNLP